VGAVVGAARLRAGPARPAALAVLGLGLACALGFAVRDGALMNNLNALGVLSALALGAAFLRLPGFSHLSVGGVVLAILTAIGRGFYGFPTSLGRFPWQRLRGGPAARRGGSRVLIGVLLTVPVLLIFGALLGSADAGFGKLLARLFQWDLGDLPATLLQLVGWAFFIGAPVYAALLARRALPPVRSLEASGLSLGLVELGIPLLSLSLLFCAYLGVQASYFFGDGPASGLTYAEAVRRGFGELSTVATLTLVLLLLAHALLRRELRAGLPYRAISAAVLLPLALLIVSAYVRLSLYVSAYGLSEIRVLGAVFLAWVSVSLLAFAVLGARGRLERFAYFSLISGLSLIATLNVVNPGRLIASVNIQRDVQDVRSEVRSSRQRASFSQLVGLGADAAPVIQANLTRLTRPAGAARIDPTATIDPETQRLMDQGKLEGRPSLSEARLQLIQTFGDQPDWRTWNWARSRARALVLAGP
jgi:Domain of unknown function (DUF4173)